MLNPGAVTSVFSGQKKLENGGIVNLNVGDNKYRLKVVSNDRTPSKELKQNSKLLLTAGSKSQTLYSVTGHDGAHWALLWAGDLDGDGKLDLYMDLNDKYSGSQQRLFLSTQAAGEDLVKEVVELGTVGC